MSQSIQLFQGDNRDSLRRLIDQGVRVHSVVTDPPYGLTSMVKRFGKKGAAAAKSDGNDGSFSRLSTGFMGQTWDGTQIERDPEFWRLIHDILLPGGYCFAFSGSRTGHWQAVAMEQAGFIMHPMHGWIYGQGFPKTRDAQREVNNAGGDGDRWEGWKYSTQAQKPALEPIYLAQKPMSEKSGGVNLVKHGVGAVNIDGCRVPLSDGEIIHTPQSDPHKRGRQGGEYGLSGRDTDAMHAAQRASVARTNALGRYPANLLHDGSEAAEALFPDGAARYFNSFSHDCDWEAAMLSEHGDLIDVPAALWNVKAAKQDRDGSKHPTVKPISLMQHLVRHVTPPGGVVLDPFAGSGTTGVAAIREGVDCILMESDADYFTFLEQRFDANISEKQHTKCETFDCESTHRIVENIQSISEIEFEDLLGGTPSGSGGIEEMLAELLG
jgi:site-specific DNA-methyltransferase (adenine-specific)